MLSYSQGPTIPLLDRTIGEQLEYVAERWSDRLAVVSRHQQYRLTWADMLTNADRLAHALAELGVKPRDRVGV